MSLLISSLSGVGMLLVLFSGYFGGVLNSFCFLLDSLSLSLLWLSSGVILAALASNFLKMGKVLWWWLVITLFVGFSVKSLFYFYIMFELSLIPILLMILTMGSQPERLSAGSYLLFYTAAISVPYLVVIFMIDFVSMGVKVQSLTWSFSGVLMLLLTPFLIKMPMFGFHFWLPKAHVEASTGGSMVLAGMLLKLGSYGAARIIGLFSLGFGSAWVSGVWVVLAFLSSAVTFMQSDLKKLVAYSSVTHMTFMVVGLITSSKLTLVSVVMVSLSHGWGAMAMFAMAGTLSHSTSSRLGTLVGSESSLFWVMILFGVILISNAGIPPMPSFFPEVFMVLSCITSSGYSVLLFLGLSMLVCYYNAYLFLWVSHMKSSMLVSGSVSFLEGLVLYVFVLLSIESLFWLQMF